MERSGTYWSGMPLSGKIRDWLVLASFVDMTLLLLMMFLYLCQVPTNLLSGELFLALIIAVIPLELGACVASYFAHRTIRQRRGW